MSTIDEVFTSRLSARELREEIQKSVDSGQAAEVSVRSVSGGDEVIVITFEPPIESYYGLGTTPDGKEVFASLGPIEEQDVKYPMLLVGT